MPRTKRGSDVLAVLRENLARTVETATGGNKKQFALKAGLGTTFVRDVMEGQDPGISKLAALAKTHHLSIDRMIGLDTNPANDADAPLPKVIGEVSAGSWHHLDGMNQADFEVEPSPFPPDPRYAIGAQFDLVVRGSSINRFARDGMRLRCVDLIAAGIEVEDNDLVIFRKTKDDGELVQTTAKRYRRRGSIVELWPDSDDPRWQTPERIDTRNTPAGEEGAIVALVLYAYNPASRRR